MTGQQNQSQQPQSPRSKVQRDLSNLKGRMTRIEKLVDGGHKLEDVLPAVTKLSVDEVRALLEVPADMELTLNVLTAGIVWKLNQLSEQVDQTHRRVHTLEDRVNRFIDTLGYSEDKEGAFIMTALVPAIQAGARNDDASFYGHLLKGGMEHDDIVRLFRIVTETSEKEGIPNTVLFERLTKVTDARLKDLEKTVAEHDNAINRIMGTGEGNLNIPGRVNNLEASHREIREMVTETQQSSFPIVGFVIGCVLGIIGGILWATHNWGNGTHTATSTVKTKAGKASVTNVMHNDVLASHWWVAALFGVAILAIVTGFAALRSRSTTKTESETTTTSSTDSDTSRTGFRARLQRARARYQSNREERRQQAEEERAQGSHFIRGTNSDDPRDGETQVLPAASEEENPRKAKVNA